VVSIVATFRILREAPLGTARLRADHHDRTADKARLLQCGADAQWADGTDVNLLELLVEIHVVEGLVLLPEVTRVVDHVI
jgi:hypothetical protein